MTRAACLPLLVCLFFINHWAYGQINSFPYSQSFEENFHLGTQVAFLPAWWGNDVGSSARLFQTTTNARSGQAALAAEPTSTFVADIRLLLNTEALPGVTLGFWARSEHNGTGSRPSQLLLSFSADGGTTFTTPVLVGAADAFPNAATEFKQYTYSLPPELAQNPQAVVRWQVRRSEEGAGTAARIFLDDVTVMAERPRLQLLSVASGSATRLLLHFNLPVDKASAENLSNYSILPATTLHSAVLQTTDPRQILLVVEALTAGEYTLKVRGLQPAGAGDPLEATSLLFQFTPLPQFRDVVINELFADPNPKGSVQPQPVILPTAADAEFIELFNASAVPYQLQQLQLNGTALPLYSLAPKSYVLLVPAGKAALYSSYGPLVEVPGWRRLGNSGARLQLAHGGSGVLLDSLSYDQSWYREAGKQEGGWSLEQVNPFSDCSYAGNWRASADARGATPAAPNAVLDTIPDTHAPRLLQAVAPDPQQLVLLFDEYVAPASVAPAQLRLEPALAIAAIQHQGERLHLQLEAPLTEGVEYRLYLRGLTDCSSNTMEAEEPIIQPRLAEAGELIINEIMYDPTAAGAEWVELHNITNHYLNLQDWLLGLREGKLKATVNLSAELLLLAPKEYLVLTASPEQLREEFSATPAASILPLNKMPNLRNSGDTLVLLNPAAQTAEVAPYSDKLHHSLLYDRKGVSLERIDANAASQNSANWTSAAFPPGGTPGRANSQQRSLAPVAEALRIEPEVVEPTPDGVADAAFIHYQMPQPGLSGTLLILDASGREIQRLASNQLLGQEGVFQWNGTDSQGARVRNGYYIVILSAFGTNGFRHKWRKTLVVSSWH